MAPGFARAIQNASMYGRTDNFGNADGVQKIEGYVCAVHGFDDEDESLRGTVDVQEWQYMGFDDEAVAEGEGHHAGVLCSAINKNSCGFYMMPSLYSDVVITQDPASKKEYVLMYSHVDIINLQSHKSVKVGVVETEEFQEGDDDGPDVNELPETGNAATTEYDKGQIVDIVKTKDGSVTIRKSINGIEVTAKDSSVIINSDGSVEVKSKNVVVTGEKAEFKGGSLVKKGEANTDGLGAFCSIPVCPFTGAIHVGSQIQEK